MKLWIRAAGAALAVCLLAASCGREPSDSCWLGPAGSCATSISSAPSPEPIFSSLEDYPIVDGSTANLPLMARVMKDSCGITWEEAESLTVNSGTNISWNRLANGQADLLLVYEAPEETKKKLEESGVQLEVTPVGRDALVFLVNSGNPVTDLTQDQLRSIYTGDTVNWKKLGGEDQEIFPFQRNPTSGSQTLFLKLLMKEVQPMDAPEELVSGAMGQLIDSVASYDNSDGAIGYSVYYYAAMMYENPSLRLLSVDGVEPSHASIADGSYPLLNDFYLAIRAGEPEESPARKLRDWILSNDGRRAFEEEGYVPIF